MLKCVTRARVCFTKWGTKKFNICSWNDKLAINFHFIIIIIGAHPVKFMMFPLCTLLTTNWLNCCHHHTSHKNSHAELIFNISRVNDDDTIDRSYICHIQIFIFHSIDRFLMWKHMNMNVTNCIMWRISACAILSDRNRIIITSNPPKKLKRDRKFIGKHCTTFITAIDYLLPRRQYWKWIEAVSVWSAGLEPHSHHREHTHFSLKRCDDATVRYGVKQIKNIPRKMMRFMILNLFYGHWMSIAGDKIGT